MSLEANHLTPLLQAERGCDEKAWPFTERMITSDNGQSQNAFPIGKSLKLLLNAV